MKMKWLLPLLGFIFLVGCSNVKDPEFRRVENFRLKNMGFEDVTIGFKVTYFNPNKFGVTVKEADAGVYLDSVYLGRFRQDTTVEVNKNAEFSIPMTGKVALSTALQLNLQDLTERQVLIKAEGNVKVGRAGIFVSRPFKYEGKHSMSELNLN